MLSPRWFDNRLSLAITERASTLTSGSTRNGRSTRVDTNGNGRWNDLQYSVGLACWPRAATAGTALLEVGQMGRVGQRVRFTCGGQSVRGPPIRRSGHREQHGAFRKQRCGCLHLDQAKLAVLNSLSSIDAQRGYPFGLASRCLDYVVLGTLQPRFWSPRSPWPFGTTLVALVRRSVARDFPMLV